MERKILTFLKRWKKDPDKKPLLIYGNKQVGKTYSVLKFGELEYKNVVYFNSDNNEELSSLFKKEKTIDKIVMRLGILSGETILKNDTLIVIDNVNDKEIVSGIKLFGKNSNDYNIIMITSLRENLSIFKGEELQYKMMTALDFEEYLVAIDNAQLIEFIKTSFKNSSAMPFHQVAMDYYDEYLSTGGMPEAVELSLRDKNKLMQNSIFDKIIDTYKKEIANQDNLIDITRSIEVLDSVPSQLQKSNKKFQYGLIKSGSRSKDYEHALNFLHNNGFIYKSFKVSDIKSPLSSCKDKESFKVYLNDTGLLYKKMHLNQVKFLTNDIVKNIIYENSIAISLVNAGYSLYYYQSEGKAEISFVIQTRAGKIVPIELVDKNMAKSKSLALFMNKFKIPDAIRITDDNFTIKKGIRHIPIYALFCIGDL
jgi:hypothetical protein